MNIFFKKLKFNIHSDLKRGMALSLFLFLSVCSFSQTYFSKLLPGWENTGFIETDSSYISIGMNNTLDPYRNFIQISHLKKNGLQIDTFPLKIDTHTHTQLHPLGQITISQNESNYVIGDGATSSHNAFLFKLNNKSTSIDLSFQDTSYKNTKYHVIKLKHNGLFAISGSYGFYKKNTFIKVIDTNGNLLWTKSYTIPFKNIHLFPKDIVETSDSGFLLLCQEEEPMFQQIGRTIKLFRPLLIKTDSLGNEQWRKNLGDYRYNNYATNIIKGTEDTNYFVSWHNQDSILYHFGLSPDKWQTHFNDSTTIHLSKIGESGTTVWTKTFKEPNKNSILPIGLTNCMIKSFDNHIIIGGGGGDETNYGCGIAKFTQEGELLWVRNSIQFPDSVNYPNSFTLMKTLKETKDKGFIFGGEYRYNVFPYTSHAYIMKLDQYGCMEPGCHLQDQWYLDSLAQAKNKSNKGSSILLYPNPTHGEITIKLPASFSLESPVAVSIISTKGNLVSSFKLNDYTTTYSTTHLSKGLYIFKFTSKGLGNETIKVVVN